MIILAIPFIITFIISILLGTFVVIRDEKSLLNIIFSIFCYFLAIISFAEFETKFLDNYIQVYYWYKVIAILPITAFLQFLFILFFFEEWIIIKRKKIIIILFLIPAIVFLFLGLLTDELEGNLVRFNDVWLYTPPDNYILYDLMMVYILLILLSSFIMVIKALNSIKNPILTMKNINKILLEAIILFIFLGIANLCFMGVYNIFAIYLFRLFFLLLCPYLAFSLWRLKFYNFRLTAIADKIVLNLSDCLVLTDIYGKILAYNEKFKETLSYDDNTIRASNLQNFISEESFQHFTSLMFILNSQNNTGSIEDIELNFKRRDNKIIPFSISVSKIQRKKGTSFIILFICRDITERKKVELELKSVLKKQKKLLDEVLRASKFKSNFLATMSHEFRTPLNSIIGFSDLLLEESYGELNEDQKEFLEDIKQSSEHLLNLINRLLDLSKIEAGKIKLNIEKIRLKDLINQIQSTIRPLYTKKKLYFKIEGLENNQEIYADRIRLQEVFYNLLSNAIKFTEEGGITLQILEKDSYWYFNIKDTGIGIPEKNYSNIFSEFTTVEDPFKTPKMGTGLGLAITKRLVNLHGGHIYFSSKVGEGTTFTFNIPKKIKDDENIYKKENE
ncbi:MAG: ATP-binding protein [Promethearchaeia archaeon]